jgi:hypothetical protein
VRVAKFKMIVIEDDENIRNSTAISFTYRRPRDQYKNLYMYVYSKLMVPEGFLISLRVCVDPYKKSIYQHVLAFCWSHLFASLGMAEQEGDHADAILTNNSRSPERGKKGQHMDY